MLSLHEFRQVGDVEIPAVGAASVHQTECPEIAAAEDFSPGDGGMVCLAAGAAAANQFQLGGIDGRFLFGPVAEPPGEDNAPGEPEQAEDPEGRASR